MYKNLKVCIAGLLISFVGALPLGSLNITAFDISASQGFEQALLFAFAAIFVELIYVRLTLWGSQKIVLEGKRLYIVLALAVALLLYLAISSLLNAYSGPQVNATTGVLPKITSPILLGLLLSAFNPLQVPFWLTWNKVLESKEMLEHKTVSFISYMFGIGSGTLMGMLVFIYAGKLIVNSYGKYAQWSNLLLGLLYLGFSFYLLFKLYRKHHKLKIQ